MYEVVSTERAFDGYVAKVRVDQVRMPDGKVVGREVIEHPGAVAVVALDERRRVGLIRQYRHPIGQYMVELPAGLLDTPGESARETAKRELAEEAGLAARVWSELAVLHTSPGISAEKVSIFLAAGLSEVPRGEATEEEAGIIFFWKPLERAVADVMQGEITNSLAVAGILAAARRLEAMGEAGELLGEVP